MDDSYGYLADIFAAILIMFLFPLLYFGLKQDAVSQSFVARKTEIFVDEIRIKGYLTKEMYDQYLEEISITGLYDISMKHRQLIHEPEYRFRTPEEVMEQQNSGYTGSNYYTYREVTTQAPKVDDPINNAQLNSETNESVLAAAFDTPASPNHVHTDACYHGTKHVHTGSSSSGGGCYSGSSSYTCTSPLEYQNQQIVTYDNDCTLCHGVKSVHYTVVYQYYRCMSGHYKNITSQFYRICSICGDEYYTSDPMAYIGMPCGQKVASYSLCCGKLEEHYYNGNTEVFPICSQIVTSITPTHPVQTVAAGDPLITTVTASFQDGSTKVVIASSDYNTNNIAQNQKVTLTYSYMISGVSYSKTSSITVTVIPRSRTCTNGHTYNLNSDGSDPGCPYCRAWLRSLQIASPTEGSISIYIDTSLPENGVTLLATYLDGRQEYLHEEYLDNLDDHYLGTQTVTLTYKGKYVSLTVITKRNLRLCKLCGRYYELYPDGSDPGCPFCLAKTPIFTNNVMEYHNEINSDEILKELYEGSGIYYFSAKDYLLFDVTDREESWGMKVLSSFRSKRISPTTHIIYGGYIRENGN